MLRHRSRLVLGTLAGVLLGVLIVGVVVAVVRTYVLADKVEQTTSAIRGTQQTNTGIVKSIEDLATDINSCTNPEGKCAKRGQRNTAKAVDAIALRQVAAVACADRPGTQTPREIKACVERSLRVIASTEDSE